MSACFRSGGLTPPSPSRSIRSYSRSHSWRDISSVPSHTGGPSPERSARKMGITLNSESGCANACSRSSCDVHSRNSSMKLDAFDTCESRRAFAAFAAPTAAPAPAPALTARAIGKFSSSNVGREPRPANPLITRPRRSLQKCRVLSLGRE